MAAAYTSIFTYYLTTVASFLASDPIIYIFGAFVLIVIVKIIKDIFSI